MIEKSISLIITHYDRIEMSLITCFGEMLWDQFPNYKNIGGAPLNVSHRLHYLGVHTCMISCVGNDKNGRDILTYLQDQNMNISCIQSQNTYPTGEVNIELDENNNARFTIRDPVAWDFIQLSDANINKVKNSAAFIFGSLAARNKLSRSTLEQLLKYSKFKVFDVNLRAPHYKMNHIINLLQESDFIKFNQEELEEIADYLQIQKDVYPSLLHLISKRTNTRHLCLTLGEKGAIFLSDGTLYVNNGYSVKVKDSVGAGDSFLATLIHHFLKGNDLQIALDISCATGALVASKKGANPVVSGQEIKSLINNHTQ